MVVKILALALAESILLIELIFKVGVPFENHELFVVKNEVRPFVESGEYRESFGEFACPFAILLVSAYSGFAKFD